MRQTCLTGKQAGLAFSQYSPDENSIKFLQNDKIPAAIRNARKNASHPNIILTKTFNDVNGAIASQASVAGQLTLQGADVSKLYELEQNYPNPFNPTTIINYQMPKDGLVTLKIYDELGREVTTLVNRYQSKGNYSVNFNAGKLASGVYFYQLRAGNYIATKKLLLIK